MWKLDRFTTTYSAPDTSDGSGTRDSSVCMYDSLDLLDRYGGFDIIPLPSPLQCDRKLA